MNMRLVMAIALATGLLVLLPTAHAAWIWDIAQGDNSTITDGSGTWQDGAKNWNQGAEPWDANWDNTNPQAAQFGTSYGSTASNVTITGTVKALGLTDFRQHRLGYDGTNPTGGTIQFTGSSPQITMYYRTYVYSSCATDTNVDVVTLTGAGTGSRYVWLMAANAFDAPLVVGSDDNGILAMGYHDHAWDGLSAAGITVKTGSTLRFGMANIATQKSFTIAGDGLGGRGALQFYQDFAGARLDGRNLTGAVILAADAAIQLGGENTISGSISGDRAVTFKNANASSIPGTIHLTNGANSTKSLVVVSTGQPTTVILDANYAATESVAVGLLTGGQGSTLVVSRGATLTSPSVSLAGLGSSKAVLAGGGTVGGDVSADSLSVIKPGTSIGTLTVAGDLSLGGTLDVEYNSDEETMDMLAVSGNLDLTGGTLSFSDLGSGTLGGGPHIFATYGTLSPGRPAEIGVPAGWRIDYAYAGNSVALVPEPASLVLLASLSLVLAGRRLRREQ